MSEGDITVRIPKAFMKDAKDHLIMIGEATSATSNLQVIKRYIGLVMYNQADIAAGKSLCMKVFEGRDPLIKGKVAKWASQADWEGLGKHTSDALPSAVQDVLDETRRELDSRTLEVHGDLFRSEEEEIPEVKVNSNLPPWNALPQADLDKIRELYPDLPSLVWAEEGELKRKALACAFAVVPKILYKSTKVMEIAINLHKEFLEWRRSVGEKET